MTDDHASWDSIVRTLSPEEYAARNHITPSVAEILTLETEFAGKPDSKSTWVLRNWGLSVNRYTQLLVQALDSREALEVDPIMTRHLRERIDRAVSRRRLLTGQGDS